VREVRKTVFKVIFVFCGDFETYFTQSVLLQDIRVVTLGSRKTLCINPDVSNLGEERINDSCLDLQQNKGNESSKGKKSKGCPFLSADSQREFSDKLLSKVKDWTTYCSATKCYFLSLTIACTLKVMDIEECVGLAKEVGSCSYYASREASSLAELVVLPYNSILHGPTRKSLGIELKGNVVILDEAHNIIETINSIHGASIRNNQGMF
jgi:chromosome transmission fidelity protein 1